MIRINDSIELVLGIFAIGCWVFLVFELPDALPAPTSGLRSARNQVPYISCDADSPANGTAKAKRLDTTLISCAGLESQRITQAVGAAVAP